MRLNTERDDAAKIIVFAHCILNLATRWWQNGKPVERNQGAVDWILGFLSERRIGALQLSCPEFTFCGNPRPPRTKDEYENLPGFRLHCERLAGASAQNLKNIVSKSKKPSIRILAVVGVERSPTCGVKCTPRTVEGVVKYVEEKGLFFEMLDIELKNLRLEMPFVGVDLHRPEDSCKKLNELLE